MKRHLSISLRLTCWFSVILLGGFIAFGALMWWDLAWSLEQGRDRTLAGRARRMLSLLQATAADSADRRWSKFADFREVTPEGNLIRVIADDGRRIFPESPTTGDSFPWPADAAGEFRANAVFGGRPYRVYSVPAFDRARQIRIYVAGQLDDNRNLLGRFLDGLKWSIPGVIALSGLFGYFVSRRALTPVNELIVSARSISIGNLSERLPVSPTGDELARLAETCNDMLARLDDSVRCINRFTADASHELRSPLSVIRVVAESALRRKALEPEMTAAFHEIVAEVDHASSLLEEMLTLARSDAGDSRLDLQPVDLSEAIAETCERMRPLASQRRHALVEDLCTQKVSLLGDPSTLYRLIRILLDNAIKYTPPGGRIEISLRVVAAKARLEVRDEGIGIAESALPFIFDRFFRADESRSQEEGTGLGLAIAKWIAEAHGGSISAVSTPREGSTFAVELPLTKTLCG